MNFQATTPIDAASATYSLQNALDTIHSFTTHNPSKLVCLFMGRSYELDGLPLPQEESALWVSLDERPTQLPLKERIHLHLDFNDHSQMERIKGLFDLVVLDQSTLKFVQSAEPWEYFGKLLKPKPGSLLITEAYPHPCGQQVSNGENFKAGYFEIPSDELSIAEEREDELCKQYIEKMGTEQFNQEYETFKASLSEETLEAYRTLSCEGEELDEVLKETFDHMLKQSILQKENGSLQLKVIEKYQHQLDEKTIPYLQTLFDSVQLVRDRPFPYEARWNNPYYILQGPRSIVA